MCHMYSSLSHCVEAVLPPPVIIVNYLYQCGESSFFRLVPGQRTPRHPHGSHNL